LVIYAKKLGLKGLVAPFMTIEDISYLVKKNIFVMLSIDLYKLTKDIQGSHLILIHKVDGNKIYINNSSNLFDDKGDNIIKTAEELDKISNKKGILLWKEI